MTQESSWFLLQFKSQIRKTKCSIAAISRLEQFNPYVERVPYPFCRPVGEDILKSSSPRSNITSNSIAISMVIVQINSTFYYHQFRTLQLGQAMLLPRNHITLISPVFQMHGKGFTMVPTSMLTRTLKIFPSVSQPVLLGTIGFRTKTMFRAKQC